MAKFLTWFYRSPETRRTFVSVIGWWEVRRIPYNAIIGLYGFICLLLFYFFIIGSGHLQPGEDAVEPMALFAAPIAANFAYTGGWLFELTLRYLFRMKNPRIGAALLRLGVIFSLLIASLPPAVWGYVYLCEKLN